MTVCKQFIRGGAVAVAILLLTPVLSRADRLWIGSPGASPIITDGIKIQGIDGDKLTYANEQGASVTKPLALIQLINVDGETTLNTAEDAFAKTKQPEEALKAYMQLMQVASTKDWIKRRAGDRLAVLGNQLNRYDAQVVAYTAVLVKDPDAAAAIKPGNPGDNSPYLDTALSAVTKAQDAGSLSNSQKAALLRLQLDIYRAKKDSSNVTQTLQQLTALGGATPEDAAMLKVVAAKVALDAKQYTQAINDIEQNKQLFTDPDSQIDALYVLAQARDGLNGEKADSNALKDIALAYLRVVTFSGEQSQRYVPESLLRAGEVEEKLNDSKSATAIYNQLIKNFANSPEAGKAKDKLAKIGK